MADTVAPGDLLPTVPVATKGSSTPTPKVGDVLPTVEPGNQKLLGNAPNETEASGATKNFLTSLIQGAPHYPSPANPVFVHDLGDMTNYILSRAKSVITGIPVEQILKQHAEAERRVNASAPWLPSLSTPSGEDVTKPILERTGEYTPTTTAGRIGSAGVQAATAMGPGGLRGLVQRVLTGGAAGGLGQTATELTGDPLASIIAGSVVPGAKPLISAGTKGFVSPFIPSMRQPAAARTLAGAASNPEAVAASTRGPVAGETLGESTLDPGILKAERTATGTSEDFQKMLAARDIAREERRQGMIQNLTPEANPMDVANIFRKHLDDVEADQEAAYNFAKMRAQKGAASIQSVPTEELGQSFRGETAPMKAGRQSALGQELDALDPEGKLNAVAAPISDQAAAIRNRPNQDLNPITDRAMEMIKRAELLKPVEPFNRLRVLDQALTTAMREAKDAKDAGYNDIRSLKSAVKSSFANAAENQVKWEQQAVARGEMAPEDTFASKLRDAISSYYAGKESTLSTEDGRALSAVRPGNVSAEAGVGPGQGPVASGEGPAAPNLTPESSQRLADINRRYGEFRSLYDAEPLKSILAEKGFKGQYSALDSDVMAKAFPTGDKGFEMASRALEGAGNSPQALSDMKAYAVSRLRNEMKGDVLQPGELAIWQKKYGPALRAIDSQSPGFSDQFNNAASATKVMERASAEREQAVKDAQKGIAGKFLNLTHPGEVGGVMMNMVRSVDGPTQISNLAQKIGEDGMAGARHAVAQEITRLSPNEMKKLVNKHGPALDTLFSSSKMFGPHGGEVLKSLAEEQERIQQATRMQVGKTGSNTFDKLMAGLQHLAAEGHQTTLAGAMGMALGLGAERLMEGQYMHAASITGSALVLGLVRTMRARGLHNMRDLIEEGLSNPAVGRAMVQQALDEKGNLRTDAVKSLTDALKAASVVNQVERRARAFGGSVSRIDYAAKAAQLLRMAEKAKKAHGKTTASLLRYPDEIISGALRLANQDR